MRAASALEAPKIEGLFGHPPYHESSWYESCCMGQSIEENKEAAMNTLVTLTATTVLLSSLFLLRRIW